MGVMQSATIQAIDRCHQSSEPRTFGVVTNRSSRSHPPTAPGSSAAGVALVVAAALVTQTGAAIAYQIFDRVGAQGAVFLRLLISSVLLWIVFRPSVRAITTKKLPVILGFGLSLGAMNMCIYQAIARLPLGVAVTIELLGPLVLSVVLSRKLSGLLWAGLALVGVLLLSGVGPSTDGLDPVGVAFALAAACMWALYILMSRQAGREFPGTQGLALAMVVGALLAAPFGVASGGVELLDPWVLLIGALIAVMSSAVPYALELASLRLLAAETFAILVSLAPAIAALVGWVMLGQALDVLEIAGIGLVILASAAVVRSAQRS